MTIYPFVYLDTEFYSLVPGLKDIDIKLGIYNDRTTGIPLSVFEPAKQTYEGYLSNGVSFEELFKSSNISVIHEYVIFLQQSILDKVPRISDDEAMYLIKQKINLLETAYSNLVASSQQTSNSS
jgi:hypothetical protein